jgi:5,10-methenyltetrahydromethanopterin hydrogenase
MTDLMNVMEKINNLIISKSTEPKTKWKEIYSGKGEMDVPILDAHCWCELNGEVIYDPKYKEHKMTQKLFKLTKKTIYKKFNPLLQKLCFKIVNDSRHNNYYYDQVKEAVKKNKI